MTVRFTWAVGVVLTLCVGAAITTAALASEPNETQVQATGPVAPGSPIDGTIEVKGDRDWYFFYTAGPAQLTFTVSNLSTSSDGCYWIDVDFRDAEGRSLGGVDNHTFGGVRSFSYSAPRAARFYLEVENDSSCDPAGQTPTVYRIAIDPPSALTTAPPVAPPPTVTTPPPPPAPPAAKPPPPAAKPLIEVGTTLSASRRGNRIVGRLSSRDASCVGSERLALRRAGSGLRRYGTAATRSNGTYSVTLPRRRGRYYVVHVSRTWSFDTRVLRCGYSRSRSIAR